MLDKIQQELNCALEVLQNFLNEKQNLNKIADAAKMIAFSVKNQGKIMACGNGGSHCDAMHFAEELTGRYRLDRPAYPALAISDPSHISCVGNDFGFDHVFSRFIEAHGNKQDVLFVISTSGNSKNIIKAINAAKQKNMKVVSLTGKDGGVVGTMSDLDICIPYFGFADRIQEMHIKIIHILILLIEEYLASN